MARLYGNMNVESHALALQPLRILQPTSSIRCVQLENLDERNTHEITAKIYEEQGSLVMIITSTVIGVDSGVSTLKKPLRNCSDMNAVNKESRHQLKLFTALLAKYVD